MKKFVCTICGFIYDEEKGLPESGIAPKTKWEDVPENFKCPLCGASKADFKEQIENKATFVEVAENEEHSLREMNAGELSALCSNLAKGCEKQYFAEEAKLFTEIAEYYKAKTSKVDENSFDDLIKLVENDLNINYPQANAAADVKPDRGAKRALVWSEKVTRMVNSVLARYKTEGDAMLKNTKIYVCDICGFIYIGDNLPKVCPVCKVPNFKMIEVGR